jgi:alkylation response protein AidB-like acyl-CoA dehydrogenase
MSAGVAPTTELLLTEEQAALAASVAEFCRRECGTREQRDALTENGKHAHNQALYRKMAELGWAGLYIPEEYGGAGAGLVEYTVFWEETWRGMAPINGAGSSATVSSFYKRYGTEKQKLDALGAIAAGAIFAISISEPEAGSDVGNISTRAVRGDGGWILDGQKTWCSSAHIAERLLLIARTSREESRQAGLTAFEVSTSLPGVDIRGIDTLGGREVNDVYLTEVFVPDECVVGDVGRAWPQVMAGLNGERVVCAAQGIGMARRTLDDLLDYVRTRKQFGKPIGTFQALRHRIADLATEVECCRLLTYDVAQRVDTGRGTPEQLTRLTSMAKLKVTETAKRVALEGMQMMGGYGYACEYDMERHVRDALAPCIYAGTNEIQREIIAATYGLR